MYQSFEALPPDDELREILESSLQPPKSREEEERPGLYRRSKRNFFWGYYTHRLHCGAFLGLPYNILNMNHKKELPWSLRVATTYGVLREPHSLTGFRLRIFGISAVVSLLQASLAPWAPNPSSLLHQESRNLETLHLSPIGSYVVPFQGLPYRTLNLNL